MNKATFFTPNQLSFSVENGKNRKVSGYAAVFYNKDNPGTEFHPEKNVAIRMARTAFNNKIIGEIHAYWNHDRNQPLGNLGAGNLTLNIDSHGLAFSLDLPNTTLGNDIWELVGGNGGPSIVRGCSFTAYGQGKWTKEGSTDVLTFHNWDRLEEISLTHDPAFTGSSVSWSAAAKAYARQEQSKRLLALHKKM